MPVGMPARAARLPLMLVNGEWDEAFDLASATRVEGSPLERQMAVSILGHLCRFRGDLDHAWEMVRELMPRGPDSQPEDALFPYAVETLRLAVRLSLDDDDPDGADDWMITHDRWLSWSGAVRGQAESALLRAHIAMHRNDLNRAEALAHTAIAYASEPRQPLTLGAAHRALGMVHLRRSELDDALTHIEEALLLAHACEAPYERARSLLGQARLYQESARIEEADRLLNEVAEIAVHLRAEPVRRTASELMSQSGVSANHFTLTPRELDVLRLVAEGLTDAEVADRLFISPRTVSQHLRSIYGKLNVSSRTQATRLAVRESLV
jgi:DNA-binding NarL/FixJ family response regulator